MKKETMHSRNIYNKRLDFKELAKEFPEFKQNTTLDLTGRVHLDFKNPAALRALSRTLLKKDFNLDVDIPLNTLVPTIPLRLNYILFIEDILNSAQRYDNIKGLDIGTGASCIYPLIAAKKNSWCMVATDIDETSIEYAKRNIDTNGLQNLINVVQVNQITVISEVLSQDTSKYDFCMCNPPFFGDPHELGSQIKRKPDRPPPRNAFTAASHEVVTEGGEVEFVSKIIEESCKFHNRVIVFTSMLGIKRSIEPLVRKLGQIEEVKSIAVTRFVQGHTTRFAIAWTFEENISLEALSNYKQTMKRTTNQEVKPYVHNMSVCKNMEEVETKLKGIFEELQLKYTSEDIGDESVLYNIKAYANTWTHGRRKRRELERNNKGESSKRENAVGEGTRESSKRQREDSDGNDAKRSKTDHDEQQQRTSLLECILFARSNGSELSIEVTYVSGAGGKDAAHQVFQHIKNHLRFE